MQILTQEVELHVDDSMMRVYAASPIGTEQYPGILLYSEIFQLTAPILRSVQRLAGHGFVVAAPEIYHRIEPIGTVIGYDDLGRMRGNDDARRTSSAEFDADCRATLDYLAGNDRVKYGQIGTMGFCIGGHLSFRCALQPDVKAAVCCYPTGLHSDKLGKDSTNTLEHNNQIRGEILINFGDNDPHVPKEGQKAIISALEKSGVKHSIKHYPGEHAFMRDEGPRYDSACADAVWADSVNLFNRVFGG